MEHRSGGNCCRNFAQAVRVSALNYHESAVVPDHKVNIPVGLERRAWRRARKDYPNPLLDAFLTLFGIAVVVIALWFLL
jgi:hypothetical protein